MLSVLSSGISQGVNIERKFTELVFWNVGILGTLKIKSKQLFVNNNLFIKLSSIFASVLSL